jgi:PKD repeat protein
VHPEITSNFTADNFEGCHPLEITFTDLSVNAINYYWDFGDGASSTETSPTHTFINFGDMTPLI